MPKVIVYVIKFNDVIKYVGITSNKLQLRINQHNCSAKGNPKNLIHRAMKKYKNQFTFEHIATAFDWDAACILEKELILQFSTYVINGGYNLTLGGEGNSVSFRSAEWRKQKSDSQKLKTPPMLGRKHTIAAKKHMSDIRKGISLEYFKVPIVDELGNYYASATDASKILSIKRSTIRMSLGQNRPLRNGKQFFYYNKVA